jgi:hypothetical protein
MNRLGEALLWAALCYAIGFTMTVVWSMAGG